MVPEEVPEAGSGQVFEQHRPRLLAMAHRMLGSGSEAEDAVQETWLRLSRSSAAEIGNLGGWLTTVVARICLNMLRSRRHEPFDVELVAPDDPEQEAVLADEVGSAMLVVLEALTPAERLAFVLHDMFAVPFEDIAGIVGRTPAATRQLASRARRRVQQTPVPIPDLAVQRVAVDAFFAAARDGDFDRLVAVLDPDIVLRPSVSVVVHGATEVARNAIMFADASAQLRPAVVNGGAGVVVVRHGKPSSVMRFTVVDGRITEIDVETSAERLRRIVLP
ncbi:sigma-70 family RNA polymerase sigma factor [Micromonospora sp. NBC_01796]|uniref:sigma-70 family RNA polymerase sigma factor n=1 Tax=Micromonospora sp. NBC_01796 TaxID=2975987 RepID=UPI002DD861A8|nr:sigma-70 family RNA polymerase sigma factor [Micromonospora sp. NBC_01796]WSA85182.1 sigma-70 family RNA polymerase sigma factor [Micromonospora sp. NBC_01796]